MQQQVLHQSYFTPVSIKAMAVTTTRKGITSKQLLLGTQANQVSLLSRMLVATFKAAIKNLRKRASKAFCPIGSMGGADSLDQVTQWTPDQSAFRLCQIAAERSVTLYM